MFSYPYKNKKPAKKYFLVSFFRPYGDKILRFETSKKYLLYVLGLLFNLFSPPGLFLILILGCNIHHDFLFDTIYLAFMIVLCFGQRLIIAQF